MLGIDIVDLHDTNLKERDERSLNLILNEKDELMDHPDIFWLLWSAKEAIFKCHREAINYAPKSIPVQLSTEFDQITFRSGSLRGVIEVNSKYILSICSDDLDNTTHEVINATETMHGDRLREEIVKYFQTNDLQFEIGSDDLNLPVLLPSNTPISISHHGRWGAFIFPTSIMD